MCLQRIRRKISCGKYICYQRKKKYIVLPVDTKPNVQQESLPRNMKWKFGIVKSKSKTKVGVSDHKTEKGMIASSDLDKVEVLKTYFC